MVKKIFFLLFLSTVTVYTYAQTTTNKTTISARDKKKQERKERINKQIKMEEEGALVYSRQSAFAFKLNTDGWGAFYEHGKYKTIANTSLWWLELGEHKSPKEEKVTTGQDIGNGFILLGNPYKYGKRNNFYFLKAGAGAQKLIGGKGNKNGVAVSAIYGGGITFGYLKPYYISVKDSTGNSVDIKYTDATAVQFLDPDPAKVLGASGFTKGFGEGKFVPGVHARLAMRFDYGRYNEFLSALEVGVNAEYYTKKMPIMANNTERQFFFNGYIAIEFGKRK